MIGLFLGSTNLSSHILKTIKKINKKYFIIDLTKNNLFKRDKSSHFINIGKFGEILNLINKKKCKKVLFAGKIDKPKISKLRMDFKGFIYLSFEITVDASLSPEGSPVTIKIFFI